MNPEPFKKDQHVFVFRPNDSFPGMVVDYRPGWVRVMGKGSIADTYFNEWFPVDSERLKVVRS